LLNAKIRLQNGNRKQRFADETTRYAGKIKFNDEREGCKVARGGIEIKRGEMPGTIFSRKNTVG